MGFSKNEKSIMLLILITSVCLLYSIEVLHFAMKHPAEFIRVIVEIQKFSLNIKYEKENSKGSKPPCQGGTLIVLTLMELLCISNYNY